MSKEKSDAARAPARQARQRAPRRRGLRILGYAALACLLALPLALAWALTLALEDQPRVNRAAEFTPEHIARAKLIAERNNPRKMRAGVLRTLSLGQEDLDLALNYLAGRYAKGSSRIALTPGAAALSASFELPANPFGRYLNVSAVLHETPGLPGFDLLQVGRLPVPEWLADLLLERALEALNTREDYRIASDTIRSISVADGRLTVVYDWQDDLPDRIRTVMLPAEDQARLKAYQERLVAHAGRGASYAGVSMAELLVPLFALAAARGADGDPVAENRAAILVLAFHVNGKGLAAIVPTARDWPQPPQHRVLLAGRNDFPKHFMISAALAAYAGAPLSDAIGLYKEVDDARSGSGFSFNDIAADRAGTRFGELAAGNRASATRLQRRVGGGVTESDVMPPASDLPEYMTQAEFQRRFGGIGAPPYKAMMADIEGRVAALPLYR